MIAEQILSTSLTTKQAIQFYNTKTKQMSKKLTEKEKSLEEILLEPKNNLCESSKCLFHRISSKFLDLNPNIKVDPKYRPQIARNYLLSTLEEHGILAIYQERNDCIELQRNTTSETILKRFYPQFFDCCIEKLNLSCSSISDGSFGTLCEILQNIQALSHLAFSLKEPNRRQIELISCLVLSSRTIQRFSCDMPLKPEIQNDLKEYIRTLLDSKRTSGFCIRFSHDNHVFIEFQQDLAQPPQPTVQNLKELSAELIGKNPLSPQILDVLSPFVPNFTSLRKLKLSFDENIYYDLFLQALCPVLKQSQSLQELELGFTKADLLANFDLGQQIFDVITQSNQLKKVGLFLAGYELSFELCYALFHRPFDQRDPFPEHQLEELSITIMRCIELELESITAYAGNFPQLKKLSLKVNRCEIEFEQITRFLEEAVDLNSLVSLDLAIRDFGQLVTNEKRDLEVCKCRLSQYNIQHKIVFEELMSFHLPEYVNIVSDDEGNEGDEGFEEEEESGGDEENDEEDGEGGSEERAEEVREEIAAGAGAQEG